MSWVETAKVGDQVVCIKKDKWATFREGLHDLSLHPEFGQVCTIKSIFPWDGMVFFRLEEAGPDWFLSDRFRPLITRKTDISVFQALLNPARVSEDA